MSNLSSVRFSLDVEGTIAGFQLREASGIVTREGDVSAIAKVNTAGQLVEYEVIVADGITYLRGPTGGFSEVPQEFASRFYDPRRLLDEAAIGRTMREARNARTEALENVNGQPAYRIRADFDTSLVQGLSLVAPNQQSVRATVWLERESSRLVRARLPFENSRGEETVLTVNLSNYNEPAVIEAPKA
ncbi:MAG: LppX_LprAFG lipoprotein [Actinomycetota bacterium]|nr:LppX_LprAFG lipoprotein [Actinomycetota bacterium]